MKRAILDALNAGAGRPLVRAVDRAGGEEILIDPSTDQSALGLAAAAAARSDTSGETEVAGRVWFLEVHNPPLELILVGAVHIAQALAPMAMLAGYGVSVIDPRAAFATEARFPRLQAHLCLSGRSARRDTAGPPRRAGGAGRMIPRSTIRAFRRRSIRPVSTSARWARGNPMPPDSKG